MKNLLKLSFGGIPQRRCISMSVVLMEPLEMKMVDCPEIVSTRSPRLNQVYKNHSHTSRRNLVVPRKPFRERMNMSNGDETFIGAIDQGTSSTRFLIFNATTQEVVASHQLEVTQYFPREGWFEECPDEILNSALKCIDFTFQEFLALNYKKEQIKCIGVTNQRETTIVWDKNTGRALHRAIVWSDSRSKETADKLIAEHGCKDILREKCGLPLESYFSALKIKWLMDNEPKIASRLLDGSAMIGTVDSWLLWKLTGNHVTDLSNASRTMLFNINTLQWDESLCSFFGIPIKALPQVCSSAEVYGNMNSTSLNGIPISGILGDQQAALLGQGCTKPGMAKNTYGSGCFLLQNTGTDAIQSEFGLLTTVAYKLGKDAPTHFALEGSIAAAGIALRWLRDNLGIIKDYKDLDVLASKVKDSGSFIFVPAFNGLYAPHWRPDARGTMTGITQYTNKCHMAFAAYEACCFQTRDLLDALAKEEGAERCKLQLLRVDGGMTNSPLMLQRQSDLLQVPVERPKMSETTALGAALAAGVGVGIIDPNTISNKSGVERFEPILSEKEVEDRVALWDNAVKKSLNSV